MYCQCSHTHTLMFFKCLATHTRSFHNWIKSIYQYKMWIKKYLMRQLRPPPRGSTFDIYCWNWKGEQMLRATGVCRVLGGEGGGGHVAKQRWFRSLFQFGLNLYLCLPRIIFFKIWVGHVTNSEDFLSVQCSCKNI